MIGVTTEETGSLVRTGSGATMALGIEIVWIEYMEQQLERMVLRRILQLPTKPPLFLGNLAPRTVFQVYLGLELPVFQDL